MTSQITLLPFVFLNLESVERKRKITKIEYLLNEKSFFDEIKKTFFEVFAGLPFDENKNLIKNSGQKF